MLIWIAVIILAVFLDQLTKYLTVLYVQPVKTIPIIEDVLHLTYVENTGAAFGMLKNARWVFMVASTVMIIVLLVYMFGIPPKKRHWAENLCLALIIAGGIGNMIDRVALGYVVDMIDFRLINFAVFNVADSFVCVGCFCWGLGVICSLFKITQDSKEEPSTYRQTAEGFEAPGEPAEETVEPTPVEEPASDAGTDPGENAAEASAEASGDTAEQAMEEAPAEESDHD
jgi:signal peptidase II